MSSKRIEQILLFLIALIATAFLGCGASQRSGESKPKYSEANARWTRHTLNDIGISVELPGEAKAQNFILPDEVKKLVSQQKTYQYETSDLLATLNYVVYVNGLTVNPEGGAKSTVEGLRNLDGVTNLQYTTTPQGATKVSMQGSCIRYDVPLDIHGFVMTEGLKMWMFLAVNKRSNSEAASAADRILKSVSFN